MKFIYLDDIDCGVMGDLTLLVHYEGSLDQGITIISVDIGNSDINMCTFSDWALEKIKSILEKQLHETKDSIDYFAIAKSIVENKDA